MAKSIYWYEHRSKKKGKIDFEKHFKLINNAVLWKTTENKRKHRDIKLVTTERKRNYSISETNYHTAKFFTEHQLIIEKEKNSYLWINLSIWTFTTRIKQNINA